MARWIFFVAFGFGWVQCASAQAQSATVAEQYLFSAMNQERVSRGLSPVSLNEPLNRAAALHAQQMVSHGTISHRFAGEPELSTRGSAAGARFERITENVAEGPTAVTLHDAWMHSAGHRANILDAAVDAVGIAVAAREGQLFAVEDFARTVESLSLLQQEAAVGVLLDRAGLEIDTDANARRTCGLATGYAGSEQPSFILRYTSTDLSQLPNQLRARLQTGEDHRAAVGACPANDDSAFSTYRIVVLLYP